MYFACFHIFPRPASLQHAPVRCQGKHPVAAKQQLLGPGPGFRAQAYTKTCEITMKQTMFLEGYTLFDLAQKLPLSNNVKEISYQQYSPEKLIQDGRTIVWYRPPREFPNKTFNGKPIQFFCNNCGINDNDTNTPETYCIILDVLSSTIMC